LITGFNTEIVVDGETYHLQTEDKGANNPIVETLVYKDGGKIIGSRRTAYGEKFGANPTREQITSLMRSQHKEILLGIKNKTFKFILSENITKETAKQAPKDATLLSSVMQYLKDKE
jgi:hypothetical protein